jgi:hypothetical protein
LLVILKDGRQAKINYSTFTSCYKFNFKKIMENKKITLIFVGQGYNRYYRGRYNRYKVLIDGEPIERLYKDEELKKLRYWVNRSRVLAMTVWGMRQELEAKLAVADFLKLYEDLKMKDWGKYSGLVEKKIEAIY